jgi:hypothetical protein
VETIRLEGKMDRKKIVAIATGVIAVTLSIAYLLLVQILDFRGMTAPAPIGYLGF